MCVRPPLAAASAGGKLKSSLVRDASGGDPACRMTAKQPGDESAVNSSGTRGRHGGPGAAVAGTILVAGLDKGAYAAAMIVLAVIAFGGLGATLLLPRQPVPPPGDVRPSG